MDIYSTTSSRQEDFVSVLMPVYNCAVFLDKAINSVVRQTWPYFELVIVNDGSTDDTPIILEKHAKNDSRIRIIHRENGGAGAATNTGLNVCTSEWVFIMHGDDIMLPKRLERQLEFIRNNHGLSLVSSFVYLIDIQGKIIGQGRPIYTSPYIVDKVISRRELIGGLYHVGVRRQIALEIGGYDESMFVNEDIDFYNRLCDSGHKFLIQPEFLMKYRIHGGSASVAKSLLIRRHLRYVRDRIQRRRSKLPLISFEEYRDIENGHPIWERANILRKDLAKTSYKKATLSFSKRQYLACLAHSVLSLILQPFYITKQVVVKRVQPPSKDAVE